MDRSADSGPRETGLVESVEVRSFYLCDGYDSYGDASFYDCARRFFREGSKPVDETRLLGVWLCRSAVNGPTANREQTIKFGHYKQGKPGKDNFVDKLLIQKVSSRKPRPAKMYRDFLEPPFSVDMRFNALVGETIRGDLDWVSTNWAYVQSVEPIKVFGGNASRFYDTRSAFRIRQGGLLIEHVTTPESRDQMWKVFTDDLRSTEARDSVRDKRARGEWASVADALELLEELVNAEIYGEGDPYRTTWTEQSLRAATPIARYPALENDDTEWSFPVTYSECRRSWGE